MVQRSAERPKARLIDLIAEASAELCGREICLSDAEVAAALSPEHFVAVRRTLGGPAPEVVAAALAASCVRLSDDRTAVERLRDRLADAEVKLKKAVEEL